MKHLQLMMVALFMLMGVSLTSCLNSESDPYNYVYGVMVKVQKSTFYTYFKTADGTIIEPTQESISALETNGFDMSKFANKIVNIAYRWDPTVVDVESDAESIKGVELYSIESLDAPAEFIESKGSSNDSISDMPIIELVSNQDGREYKPFFFDETTLILPIHYYMEKKVHTLRLLYYKEEAQENGVLKLYLRHNKNEDTASGTGLTSYEYAAGTGLLSLFYKAYDLRIIFSRYQEQTGAYDYPKKINIVYEANPYSWDLDDAQTETKTYTVEYKPQTAE